MNSVIDMQSDIAAALLIEKIIRDTYSLKSSSEIQPLQWSILRYLDRTQASRCTMSWIKEFLGLTHAPVVRAIKTLVARGLVEQRENPKDARSSILVLTQKGIETLASDPILAVANQIHALPEGDREKFRKYIRSIAMSLKSVGVTLNE